ncbi:MAG: phosphoribosylglycinamide formyltransferase [Acidimicrobiia bacterium]|nr:phosphoribosylglycinamide formyltransferase [Acidimicrobiia bacterium]
MPTKLPIAVLISGRGTNLQALIDASANPDFGCAIVGVISDRAGVAGLERAEKAGLPTTVVDWAAYTDRSAFTAAVCDAAIGIGAKALVLAGFMRILSEEAVVRFPHRIINVHPSLLPRYPGAHAIEQALESEDDVTGVTVHFVDELVDHGPIIAQAAVTIAADDTAESLQARVQAVEHRLLPAVVSAFGRGDIVISGGVVGWTPPTGTSESMASMPQTTNARPKVLEPS